ncbi:S24 family peptidase [Acidovorax sp. Leaf160]|uniref:XRE family transcriptional regulator n=1 Tax=Acidovorax sp. Leaf160 TaxID=1736280 RepID=UPI0009EC2E25|nr:S24 family peptidase [Acidovorax sp. Leaf160]
MESIAERLKRLRVAAGLSQAALAQRVGMSQGTIGNIEAGTRGYGESIVDIAAVLKVSPAYLRLQDEASEAQVIAAESEPTPYMSADLTIHQYETGGSMGHGFNLTDHPPGLIKSWNVSHDWLRQNVPVHTGIHNLKIVTGFGPSMRPMYNPGDPLLVDIGVKHIDHEGVYFFRVGEEGYIKILQRIPEFNGPGFSFRVISKNPDYAPYDLSPKNPHFEVLGKVLTVWRSEQF